MKSQLVNGNYGHRALSNRLKAYTSLALIGDAEGRNELAGN